METSPSDPISLAASSSSSVSTVNDDSAVCLMFERSTSSSFQRNLNVEEKHESGVVDEDYEFLSTPCNTKRGATPVVSSFHDKSFSMSSTSFSVYNDDSSKCCISANESSSFLASRVTTEEEPSIEPSPNGCCLSEETANAPKYSTYTSSPATTAEMVRESQLQVLREEALNKSYPPFLTAHNEVTIADESSNSASAVAAFIPSSSSQITTKRKSRCYLSSLQSHKEQQQSSLHSSALATVVEGPDQSSSSESSSPSSLLTLSSSSDDRSRPNTTIPSPIVTPPPEVSETFLNLTVTRPNLGWSLRHKGISAIIVESRQGLYANVSNKNWPFMHRSFKVSHASASQGENSPVLRISVYIHDLPSDILHSSEDDGLTHFSTIYFPCSLLYPYSQNSSTATSLSRVNFTKNQWVVALQPSEEPSAATSSSSPFSYQEILQRFRDQEEAASHNHKIPKIYLIFRCAQQKVNSDLRLRALVDDSHHMSSGFAPRCSDAFDRMSYVSAPVGTAAAAAKKNFLSKLSASHNLGKNRTLDRREDKHEQNNTAEIIPHNSSLRAQATCIRERREGRAVAAMGTDVDDIAPDDSASAQTGVSISSRQSSHVSIPVSVEGAEASSLSHSVRNSLGSLEVLQEALTMIKKRHVTTGSEHLKKLLVRHGGAVNSSPASTAVESSKTSLASNVEQPKASSLLSNSAGKTLRSPSEDTKAISHHSCSLPHRSSTTETPCLISSLPASPISKLPETVAVSSHACTLATSTSDLDNTKSRTSHLALVSHSDIPLLTTKLTRKTAITGETHAASACGSDEGATDGRSSHECGKKSEKKREQIATEGSGLVEVTEKKKNGESIEEFAKQLETLQTKFSLLKGQQERISVSQKGFVTSGCQTSRKSGDGTNISVNASMLHEFLLRRFSGKWVGLLKGCCWAAWKTQTQVVVGERRLRTLKQQSGLRQLLMQQERRWISGAFLKWIQNHQRQRWTLERTNLKFRVWKLEQSKQRVIEHWTLCALKTAMTGSRMRRQDVMAQSEQIELLQNQRQLLEGRVREMQEQLLQKQKEIDLHEERACQLEVLHSSAKQAALERGERCAQLLQELGVSKELEELFEKRNKVLVSEKASLSAKLMDDLREQKAKAEEEKAELRRELNEMERQLKDSQEQSEALRETIHTDLERHRNAFEKYGGIEGIENMQKESDRLREELNEHLEEHQRQEEAKAMANLIEEEGGDKGKEENICIEREKWEETINKQNEEICSLEIALSNFQRQIEEEGERNRSAEDVNRLELELANKDAMIAYQSETIRRIESKLDDALANKGKLDLALHQLEKQQYFSSTNAPEVFGILRDTLKPVQDARHIMLQQQQRYHHEQQNCQNNNILPPLIYRYPPTVIYHRLCDMRPNSTVSSSFHPQGNIVSPIPNSSQSPHLPAATVAANPVGTACPSDAIHIVGCQPQKASLPSSLGTVPRHPSASCFPSNQPLAARSSSYYSTNLTPPTTSRFIPISFPNVASMTNRNASVSSRRLVSRKPSMSSLHQPSPAAFMGIKTPASTK